MNWYTQQERTGDNRGAIDNKLKSTPRHIWRREKVINDKRNQYTLREHIIRREQSTLRTKENTIDDDAVQILQTGTGNKNDSVKIIDNTTDEQTSINNWQPRCWNTLSKEPIEDNYKINQLVQQRQRNLILHKLVKDFPKQHEWKRKYKR